MQIEPREITQECQDSGIDMPAPPAWRSRLIRKGSLGAPTGEVTPFVFRGRLYRVENWKRSYDFPGQPVQYRFHEDEVRIRDVEADRIVSVPLRNHYFGMAFVWEGRVYLFAGDYADDAEWWHITRTSMTWSEDLVHWSEPRRVLCAEGGEHIFNYGVCHDGRRFVLLYETDDRRWPAFTFKYCESGDLAGWRRIPAALFGVEKYVGGPALYYEGGRCYTLYLHDLGGKWETRLARSADLIHWDEAPDGRPFLTFDVRHRPDPERFPEVWEINASDAELCEWQGRTLVYFCGGDQYTAGDLQRAEFDGTPRELLEHFYEEPQVALPTPQQLGYQESQVGAFVHFGTATYTGSSDMLSTPDPAVFNPVDLDAEQWAITAKAMGARHIVLTAKHHSGFCLWPTRTTDYSVRSCPWKGGRGDVVREFADAARRHGLRVGLYYSCGDMHRGCHSTPEPMGRRRLVGDAGRYLSVAREQLRELLTGYGALTVVWFDGAYNPFGHDVLGPDGRPAGTAQGDALDGLVRELQPGAVVFGGTRPDVRWSGSESGWASYPLWNVVAQGDGPRVWLGPHNAGWFAVEANIHTRATWFWTPDSDHTLCTLEGLVSAYYRSIGRGANLLVNLTPDARGLIPEAEVRLARAFGQEIRRRFDRPLAWTDSRERWGEGRTLDLDLGGTRRVDHAVIEEDLGFGQRIRAYRIEAAAGGQWTAVAEGLSVGRRRIERFSPVMASALRLRVLRTDPLPKVRLFAACDAEPTGKG